MRRIAGCVLLVLINVSIALGQLPTATILGAVKDASGAVVPGATVTVRNIDTGLRRSDTTGGDGSYRFNALPVGNYEVRVERGGFQSAVQKGLTLTVSQEAVVNVELQVGSSAQTVEVSAEAPLVDTTSGSLGGLVNETRVADLPLNGRNYIDLALLQPGVSLDQSRSSGEAAWFSSNGAPVISNYYLLDGTPTRNLYGRNPSSQTATVLGVDGVKEFRVITNNMSAEYGMSMGSELVVVTKSGENQFHGDAFEYLRNNALDARNFFDYGYLSGGPRVPPFRQNQFGASAGGPIQKDKTFFYATFESLHQRLAVTGNASTFPAACHNIQPNGSGDYQFITNTDAQNCDQSLFGPGGSGPPTVIWHVVVPLLGLFPNPTPGLGNTLQFITNQPLLDNFGQFRLDHTFSTNDSIFARFTTDNANQTEQVQPFPGFTDMPESQNYYITLGETHIFNPNLLSTTRFSWAGTRLRTGGPTPFAGPQYSLVAEKGVGDIIVGGLSQFGPDIPIPVSERQYIWTWSDDVFYTRGHHSLKFGTLINRITQVPLGPAASRGVLVFPDVAHFMEGFPVTQLALTPDSNWVRTYRNETYGFYAQDDWRPTSRLTLNLGLRYEFNTVPREVHGLENSLRNVTDPTITPGPIMQNNTLHNFSPRFGFAWDVFGNGKTSVRGGFSILYDISNLGAALITIAIGQPPLSGFGQIFYPGPPFNTTRLPALPLTFPLTNNLQLMDYHLKQSSMKQFNLTIERQLPWHTALTVSYAGSLGQHIFDSGLEGNPFVPGGIPSAPGGPQTCSPAPTGHVADVTSLVDGTATACWLNNGTESRLNPNFGSIAYRTGDGNSYYNALEVMVSKQLSNRLEFQSSYTYSKSIDMIENVLGSDQTFTELSSPVDPFRASTDRGPSVFDSTHNWHFNMLYHLPSAKSEGFVGKVLSGWWVAAIETLQSGYPFTPCIGSANQSNSQISQGGTCLDRPDFVPGRSLHSITHGASPGCTTAGGATIANGTPLGTPTLYFDPCAFVLQAPGFLGNVGRNILRGPGFADLDFTVAKDTRLRFLGEQGHLEFRTEIFNILNKANFTFGNFCGGTLGAGLEVDNPNVGRTSQICDTANPAREIQFALKIVF